MLTLKRVGFFFSCLACAALPLTVFAAPVSESAAPMEAGAWSPNVEGLQGRLLVAPGPKINGTKLPLVYLELRNVSDLGSPMVVDYGDGKGLRLEVRDSQAKKVAPDMVLDYDGTGSGPYRLVLPHDSSLRFRVSLSGYGIPKNAGALLEIGDAILLPTGTHQAYFLQGTLSADAVKKARSQVKWRGTLTLPKVDLSPLMANP